MKVVGLDGKIYTWHLKDKCPLGIDGIARSELHLAVRNLLRQLFTFEKILEEVELPGSNGLAADFVIVQRKLLIEAHGEQHYKYISHFHGNINGFYASKCRDDRKQEWAELNYMKYVALPHYEGEDEWKKKLLSL